MNLSITLLVFLCGAVAACRFLLPNDFARAYAELGQRLRNLAAGMRHSPLFCTRPRRFLFGVAAVAALAYVPPVRILPLLILVGLMCIFLLRILFAEPESVADPNPEPTASEPEQAATAPEQAAAVGHVPEEGPTDSFFPRGRLRRALRSRGFRHPPYRVEAQAPTVAVGHSPHGGLVALALVASLGFGLLLTLSTPPESINRRHVWVAPPPPAVPPEVVQLAAMPVSAAEDSTEAGVPKDSPENSAEPAAATLPIALTTSLTEFSTPTHPLPELVFRNGDAPRPQQGRIAFISDVRAEPQEAVADVLERVRRQLLVTMQASFPDDDIENTPSEDWIREHLVVFERDFEEQTSTGKVHTVRMDTWVTPQMLGEARAVSLRDRSWRRSFQLAQGYTGTVLFLGGLSILLRLGTSGRPRADRGDLA